MRSMLVFLLRSVALEGKKRCNECFYHQIGQEQMPVANIMCQILLPSIQAGQGQRNIEQNLE